MARKVAHSSWLAVAVALLGLFGRPAAAYTIGSQMFAEGYGGSYTELDYGDIYEGAYYAYVDSTLSFDGNEIDYNDAYDPSDAVAYEDDDAGPGSYAVAGDHWILYYYEGWVDIGQTSDTFDDGGGGGGAPTCEYSVYLDPNDDPDYYGGTFYAVLGQGTASSCAASGPGSYSGSTFTEDIEDIDSTCYDPTNDNMYLDPDIDDNYTWDVDDDGNTYGESDPDYITYDSDTIDYYQALIYDDITPYSSCYIWLGYQAMSYNGAASYQTNFVGITIEDGDAGLAIRGIYGEGSIYPE